MEIKNISGCIVNLDTLLALDKRACEDLKNNTHNIGQEEVLTIIREFIRCKNDYKNMNKNLAKYLTVLIANDLKHTRDISSGACEMIERCFINGEFEKIEKYIRNFLNDKRTVAEIVAESEE